MTRYQTICTAPPRFIRSRALNRCLQQFGNNKRGWNNDELINGEIIVSGESVSQSINQLISGDHQDEDKRETTKGEKRTSHFYQAKHNKDETICRWKETNE